MMTDKHITKYLKLPFRFDEKRLVSDLASILESNWIPHFNKRDYDGDWKSIALFAVGGDAANIFAFQNDTNKIIETPILNSCYYLKEVINHFKCTLQSVRLLRLNAGAKIKPHCDYNLGYENDTFRLHIPITTNNKVNFILDGARLVMLPGECWYTNVNYTHSVSNNGLNNRVHLVIDGKRNAWSDELFFSLAPKESFFPENNESYSVETLVKIIAELRRSDEPAAKQLISTLQKDLDEQMK